MDGHSSFISLFLSLHLCLSGPAIKFSLDSDSYHCEQKHIFLLLALACTDGTIR